MICTLFKRHRVFMLTIMRWIRYTRRKDDELLMGHVINTSDTLMIDFTLSQAYNTEGNLKDNQEHIVTISINNLNYDTASDIESATSFTNDKIGTLLKALDPFRIDQDTVDLLVGMTSMRVQWENDD